MSGLELRIEKRDDVQVAHVGGEIDISNVRALGAEIESAISNRSFGIVIDLSDTRYLDSAGVNLLFELSDQLERRQQKLHVVVPPTSRVNRVLTMVSIESRMAVHTTVDEAFDALRAEAAGR